MRDGIVEIDIAKGLLILFVLWGCPINQWTSACINSFHMAALFCLSGFTYSYKEEILESFRKKSRGMHHRSCKQIDRWSFMCPDYPSAMCSAGVRL